MASLKVEMTNIDVLANRDVITGLMVAHGLSPEIVVYVDNIQAWCREHGIEEPNTWRCAKTLYHDGPHGVTVLLPDVITDDMVQSVTGGMLCRGFPHWRELEQDGSIFLKHLVLHEVRHVLERDHDENLCDAWAYEQLGATSS